MPPHYSAGSSGPAETEAAGAREGATQPIERNQPDAPIEDTPAQRGAQAAERAIPPAERRAHKRLWRALLIGALLVAFIGGGALLALDGYARYTHDRALAADGVRHLRTLQGLLPQDSDPLSALVALDAPALQRVAAELRPAERDFAELRADLGAPQGAYWLAGRLPRAGDELATFAALAAAADEALLAGLAAVTLGRTLLGVAHGDFFLSANAPAPSAGAPLNAATLVRVRATFDTATRHLTTAVGYARRANLALAPASLLPPKQVAQLRALLASWPTTQAALAQVDATLAALPTLLGIGKPLRLLLLVMDRSELRATGGFQGNYALATLRDGQVEPFTLTDTYLLDDSDYVRTHGRPTVPAAYPWWPFDNFGLRDANLAPDFPTSAQECERALAQEGGGAVDGALAFTPVVIERVIQIVGDVYVPGFDEMATPSSLERLIHAHQLANGALNPDRKRFTSVLAQELVKKLHGLAPAQIGALLRVVQESVRAKDIQIYLNDPQAEALLTQAGAAGTLARGDGDALLLDDVNIGGNKGSQFVVTQMADDVTLDAQGTATHTLTVTYAFHVTDPAEYYGPPGAFYYLSHLRVYTAEDARLLAASGFAGDAALTAASDEPGRRMWGGTIRAEDGVPSTLRFTWSAPHAARRDASGGWRYSYMVERQPGANQTLTLNVTAPGGTARLLHFDAPLTQDQRFNVAYR